MAIFSEQVAQQLIDFLSTKLCFDEELYSHYYDDCCEEDEDWYEDLRIQCGADCLQHGASKIVLFYDDLPHWVVKLPLIGEYYEDEDSFKYFTNANTENSLVQDDYCAVEAYLTQEAEKYGIGDMFAKTFYLFKCDGISVYVSEKMSFDYYSSYSFKDIIRSTSLAQNMSKCFENIMDNNAFARFFDAYSEEQVYELISFIEQYRINDLHHCNMGYDTEWKIRLLDYSGFDY